MPTRLLPACEPLVDEAQNGLVLLAVHGHDLQDQGEEPAVKILLLLGDLPQLARALPQIEREGRSEAILQNTCLAITAICALALGIRFSRDNLSEYLLECAAWHNSVPAIGFT